MFDKNGNLIVKTLKENQELYKEKYEKTFGLVDIEPSSALGSDLAITAEMKKIADENVAFALSQNSPYEATGEGLDNLCFLRGIVRKTDEHSLCLVTFYGADGIVIPQNSEIENSETKEIFVTNEKGIIQNGTFSVITTAKKSGRIICNANTLNKSNISDVTVTNLAAGKLGFDRESDTNLRVRLLNYSNSLSVEEKLYLNLKNIKNVKMINILSNPEIFEDANSIPPKSTAIVVYGGENKLIANEIYRTIPADKLTFGDIQETIVSSVSKKEYIINFSRPKFVDIDIYVVLSITNLFDVEDKGLIKSSIESYFEKHINMGESIKIDKFYIPIQLDQNNHNKSFEGISDIVIKMNNKSENVDLKYNEVAILNSVTVVA